MPAESEHMWILYSTAAMLLLGGMLLIIKKLSLGGLVPGVILFWLLLGAAGGAGGHLLATRQSPRLAWSAFGLVALAALASYLGNLLYIKAVALSPNPGYPVAIEGCKAAVVLVGSLLLFGMNLSLDKAVGVALCAVGVFLIAR
jgi:uncharacterized membrane protein